MAISFGAGQTLTADALNAILPVYVVKPTDQTVTNSTTFVNDTALFVNVPAGRYMEIRAYLAVNGGAGNIKIAWATSGTVAVAQLRHCWGPSTSATSYSNATIVNLFGLGLNGALGYGTNLGGATVSVLETFSVYGGASGGVLTLQFAQLSANATAAKMSAGSHIFAVPYA